MRADRVLEELEMFGSAQWGLVTTAQAHGLGIDRLWLSRMSSRGVLQRIRHGVYALPSARYGPWQDLQAAWLATEPAAAAESRLEVEDPVVVSHTSAAGVHQLGDLIASRHEFSSPARRQTTQADIRFHRRAVPAHERVWVDGLPVTSVPRTVGDLAGAAVDVDHLSQVVRDAVVDHHVREHELAERLFPHAEAYDVKTGSELVQLLLDHAGHTPDTSVHMTPGWKENIAEILPELITPQLQDVIQKEISTSVISHLDHSLFQKIQEQWIEKMDESFQEIMRHSPLLSAALTEIAPLSDPVRPSGQQTKDASPQKSEDADDKDKGHGDR